MVVLEGLKRQALKNAQRSARADEEELAADVKVCLDHRSKVSSPADVAELRDILKEVREMEEPRDVHRHLYKQLPGSKTMWMETITYIIFDKSLKDYRQWAAKHHGAKALMQPAGYRHCTWIAPKLKTRQEDYICLMVIR